MLDSSPTRSNLVSTLERVTELAEESLDPELTREDLVRRMKDIANLADDATRNADGGEDEQKREGQINRPC